MKYTVNKEEHEKLPEALQGEYAEKDGVYTLSLEGHEESLVPKFKKDEAEKHRKAAEDREKDLQAKHDELLKDMESNKGNSKKMEELRESHVKEIERIKQENAESLAAVKAETHKAMIDAAATEFAEKNFTIPSVGKDLIAKRLTVEEVEGQAVLRALEPDGKQSIKSVSDIQKEILANTEFASIIKAQSGSGGGATGDTGKGGGAGKTILRSEFDAMSSDEQASTMKGGATLIDE